MSDDLDSKTDAELNDAFAVEIAGFSTYKETRPGWANWKWWVKDGTHHLAQPPPFCTDATAVLPWLEREQSFNIDRTHLADDGEQYRVSLRRKPAGDALAATFPRAAVIALLRAKRAQKETA